MVGSFEVNPCSPEKMKTRPNQRPPSRPVLQAGRTTPADLTKDGVSLVSQNQTKTPEQREKQHQLSLKWIDDAIFCAQKTWGKLRKPIFWVAKKRHLPEGSTPWPGPTGQTSPGSPGNSGRWWPLRGRRASPCQVHSWSMNNPRLQPTAADSRACDLDNSGSRPWSCPDFWGSKMMHKRYHNSGYAQEY